jgi:hypothetical protein
MALVVTAVQNLQDAMEQATAQLRGAAQALERFQPKTKKKT